MIGGKFRSRRLKSPGKLLMRPTSDRLRETLFNVLGPAVKDSLFIDLYAGTGAIGIEALSRVTSSRISFSWIRRMTRRTNRYAFSNFSTPRTSSLPLRWLLWSTASNRNCRNAWSVWS